MKAENIRIRMKAENIRISMKCQQGNCYCARFRAGNSRPAVISGKAHQGRSIPCSWSQHCNCMTLKKCAYLSRSHFLPLKMSTLPTLKELLALS